MSKKLKIKNIGTLPDQEYTGTLPTIPRYPSDFFLWMLEDAGLHVPRTNQDITRALFTDIESVLLQEDSLLGVNTKERLELFRRMSQLVYSELKNE
jgi:hypothetical protein